MKDNKLPFSLARMLFGMPDSDARLSSNPIPDVTFDQRHDFVLYLPRPMVAVRMEFANERVLSEKSSKGVRRQVSVTLIDAATSSLHAHASVFAHIKSGCLYGTAHVCLPIDFDNVDFNHPYMVTVRDVKSGQILDEQILHFFYPHQDYLYACQWFKPVCAGVVPDYSENMYRSFDADVMSYHSVRFHLAPDENFTPQSFLPEMEVRVKFPDGSVDSKFIHPVRDENDADSESYIVSSSFYMTSSRKGICYAELICDDSPIAGIIFNTDGDPEYGPWRDPFLDPFEEYSLPLAAEMFKIFIANNPEETPASLTDDELENALEKFISYQQEEEEDTPDELHMETAISTEDEPQLEIEEAISPLKALENLTGLKSVKEKLSAYEKLVMFNKRREEIGIPTLSLPLHAMFLGSPGTGKTTVAKRMGLMLKRAGLLSKGHVVVRERASLMGIHYGDQEVKTLEALEEAQGGILFIDEAYQLFQPIDPKDPGKIVIESLLTALANESNRDWMLILAGYPDEMMRMFDINPVLKSRIPDSNIYIFDDFTEAELMEIAERYLERNQFSLSEEARISLSQRLADDYLRRDKTFGNARHVINMIQTEIIPSMAMRVMADENCTPESLTLIQSSDILSSITPPTKLKPRKRIGYCA